MSTQFNCQKTFLFQTIQLYITIQFSVSTVSMSKMVGLFGFMAYQPLQVIQRQIHFYVNNLFYWKQFSLA